MNSQFDTIRDDDRDWVDLFGAVIDGIATEAQQAALNQLLADNAPARAAYRRYVNLHVTLTAYGAARDADADPTTMPSHWWRRVRVRSLVAAVTGIAAALFIAVTAWHQFSPPHPGSGPVAQSRNVVAHYTRLTSARVRGDDAPTVGAAIDAGTLELTEGFAEITLSNDVRLVLEAPVKLDLPGAGSARLISGRLVATVPPAARGFTVDTPRARVVDLGTEFGVGVHAGGDTEVQVFRGLVVTSWDGPNGKPVDQQLVAGKAISIDSRVASTPRRIPFEPERFVRMFPSDRAPIEPGGPVYSRSRLTSVDVFPIEHSLKIDGDLSDWNQTRAFHCACEPPYGQSHYLSGWMMYDQTYIYLAAHVGDPAPMRSTMDPNASSDNIAWSGGSVIVRLCVDPKLGWPLKGLGRAERDTTHPEIGSRPEDVSEKIVHMTMWYHRPSARARLLLSYGMDFHGERTDPPGWDGAFKMDADGVGYSLEYAIPWSLLNAADRPPRAGDVMGACWTVHWSDQEGKISRGNLVEITNPKAGPFRFLRAGTWGKAVYHAEGSR